MNTGMNQQFYSSLYLADVSEEQARIFFFDRVLKFAPKAGAALLDSPSDWATIFNVR